MAGHQPVEMRREHLAGDEVLAARFDSGFTAYVMPKPGFHQKYGVVAVRYGSIDSRFAPPGQTEPVEVPEGIAHFLEHKLFEKEEGDVFGEFARMGASANAYTGYTMTAYLFSGVEHFRPSLELLLRFVRVPYFTEASVRKEQGIIEQELRMYEDDPGRCLMMGLTQALYHHHPVRMEIGGTVESIRRIDVPALYLCHETFYRPANMALAVTGDVDPAVVWELAGQLMDVHDNGHAEAEDGRAGVGIRRLDPPEPPSVFRPHVERRLAVSRPRMALGIKDPPVYRYGQELVRRDVGVNLALEAALGRASDTFRQLYEQGLIDDGFGARYFSDTRFAHTVLGGETPDPDELERRLRVALERLRNEGIGADDFERLRRKEIGEFVATLDNPEMVANVLVSLHFRGLSLTDYLDALRALELSEVNATVRDHIDPGRMAVSVVLPGPAGAGGHGTGSRVAPRHGES